MVVWSGTSEVAGRDGQVEDVDVRLTRYNMHYADFNFHRTECCGVWDQEPTIHKGLFMMKVDQCCVNG